MFILEQTVAGRGVYLSMVSQSPARNRFGSPEKSEECIGAPSDVNTLDGSTKPG